MSDDEWRPRATFKVMVARAQLLATIREFFARRKVMEVSVPVLGGATVTAPAVDSICCSNGHGSYQQLYLQTSPEYAMKRLLAAGYGAIYTLTSAFRSGEFGPRHNPEFTLLEWYRPGFSLPELMDEVHALLLETVGEMEHSRLSYRDAFQRHCDLDPFDDPTSRLIHCASAAGLHNAESASRDELLDFIAATRIEPALGKGAVFIDHYPTNQAQLAEVEPGPPPSAQRFELFVAGVELANGYSELRDAREQRRRFEQDQRLRAERGQYVPRLDERMLAALASGMEPVSGVALGVDRLLMVRLGLDDVRDTLAFPIDRA